MSTDLLLDKRASTWVAPGGEPEWLRWFDELAELAAEERAARLAELARTQPELAARLARLFAADAEGPEGLSRPVAERAPVFVASAFVADAEPETPLPADRIGPYQLLALLGRGGMGEVFLAERADGAFEQRVALKLIKRGMDSEEIVRRFHRERQILARLEHPGIARLLDGGTAPDGRPYFVLELVEGEPIPSYCRRVKVSLEERLRLIIAACEAVDAAHRSLVVHRDLKPSNLLVTAEGQVKLLDFGIAKLLAETPEEWSTQHVGTPLTPAYAAPEQLLGEPVTMATDVYALGVILYELLTGRSPHPTGRSLATLARQDASEPTERPSAVLREADPKAADDEAGIPDRRRLARRVQGDLDTVVLAALHRDPARRYRSAADFGTDLQRFLAGRTVRARPDSALYRARKLVLRHKLAAAAMSAAVLSLVAGVAMSQREARIATAQAQRAERVKELLLSIFHEAAPEKGQGPELTARQILAVGSRRVEKELAQEPEVQAELLDALAQIDLSLGLYDAGSEAGRASLAGRRRLFGAGSAEAALSLTTLAEIEANRGHLDQAWRLAERTRPLLARHFGRESKEGLRLASIRLFLLGQRGEPDKALALGREMIARTRSRYGPRSVETGRWLYETAAILGDLSRFDEAQRAAQEGLAILEASPRASPLEVSFARRMLAELLATAGRREEAAAQYAAALAQQRAAVGPDHLEVAQTQIKYGFLLSEMRRYAEAERALRDAIRILEPLGHYDAGTARRYLGFCLMSEERYAEAEQELVAAERFLRQKVGEDHPLVWAARLSEGWARLRLGRLEEAERTLSQVVEHDEHHDPEGNEIRSALKYLGEVERRRGHAGQALALHRRAREIELKLFGTAAHLGVATSDYQIALDLLALGGRENLIAARRGIDPAIAFLRQSDPGHPRLDEFLVASGRIALAAGDRTRARQDLTEAVARLREHRGESHAATHEAAALLRRAG
ncbi:MAG TPA: serine/threonine-protein kinase [Thermoanaerobaculia bacterium]|nr:serine/threonine-protein kinase [Thermoanaerobaculia bacterium]